MIGSVDDLDDRNTFDFDRSANQCRGALFVRVRVGKLQPNPAVGLAL